jgi:Phage tail lysozyme
MTALSIPAWPDPATAEGKTFFANALVIVDSWRNHGFSIPFALGMLANAEAESSLDPTAMGDRGTAFGLHQWHGDRIAAIRKSTGIDIAALPPIETQIAAAIWELSNLPWVGMSAIKSQTTAYGAAMQACALFERAGALDATQRRGSMAERWSAHFAKIIGP